MDWQKIEKQLIEFFDDVATYITHEPIYRERGWETNDAIAVISDSDDRAIPIQVNLTMLAKKIAASAAA